MNTSYIRYLLCFILRVEAILMVPCLIMAMALRDANVAAAFGITMALLLPLGLLGGRRPARSAGFYAREGFVTVGLGWILVSLLGALPFYISGEIGGFMSALFESVSGFTTTGATVLAAGGSLTQPLILWRSISHYAGGLGVLVFLLAVVPMAESAGGGSLYLLRAESTGPQVSKLLPKMRDSAKVLYTIYIALTLVMIVLLLLGGLTVFDSVNLAMSTAATGGFAPQSHSVAGYGIYAQSVIGVFMVLFGVNFNVFYLLMIRQFRKALFNEELRVYLGVMGVSVALIAVNLVRTLGLAFGPALGHSAFQVAAIMTSTGFAAVDYNLWPEFSKVVLMVLMIVGACAGSTGGGVKVARILILVKSARQSLMRALRPRQVNRVRISGTAVEGETVGGVMGYMTLYALVAVLSFLLVSLDGFSMETNLSAVIACINNTGPGFEAIGPMGSYAGFSDLSKLVLSMNMLIGRLELFPILLLFTPGVWNRST